MSGTSSITLVFPHQLFSRHPALEQGRPVWLIEDTLFFGDPHCPARFHRHKLMLHRAAMHAYADELRDDGYRVTLFEYDRDKPVDRLLEEKLPKKTKELHLADPVDYLLERRIRRAAKKLGVEAVLHETPMFLSSPDWFNKWQDGRKRYFMADFYKEQRKRLGILVDDDGNPRGGKWSYDAENRKRWPKNREEPPVYRPQSNDSTREAARYVEDRFPDNPGDCDTFWYPVTHDQAYRSLRHFLEHRFRGFGDYEDAISRDHTTLHHAVLTPALNCGLLTPQQVVDAALTYAEENDIPLNDLEGFIRQIIGWREFMRMVYVREGVRQRTSNFWTHRRKLSEAWYTGTPGWTRWTTSSAASTGTPTATISSA